MRVKTSILIVDKTRKPPSDKVAFVKVKHSGFTLNVARTTTSENDLSQVVAKLKELSNSNTLGAGPVGVAVTAKEIEDSDFIFFASNYKKADANASGIPFVALRTVCKVQKGKSSSTKTSG